MPSTCNTLAMPLRRTWELSTLLVVCVALLRALRDGISSALAGHRFRGNLRLGGSVEVAMLLSMAWCAAMVAS